jgi:hypothetical protein
MEPEDTPRVLCGEPPCGGGSLGGGRLVVDDRAGGCGRRRRPDDEEEGGGEGEAGRGKHRSLSRFGCQLIVLGWESGVVESISCLDFFSL